jgi:hypothetical protein
MPDVVSDALGALATALDGMPLSDTGNVVVARAGRQDGAAPPFAQIATTGARWANISRGDGWGVLDAEVTLVLPGTSLPVADALAGRAIADVRQRLLTNGGRTLGGNVTAWRLLDAQRTTVQLGGREAPGVIFRIELWTNI